MQGSADFVGPSAGLVLDEEGVQPDIPRPKDRNLCAGQQKHEVVGHLPVEWIQGCGQADFLSAASTIPDREDAQNTHSETAEVLDVGDLHMAQELLVQVHYPCAFRDAVCERYNAQACVDQVDLAGQVGIGTAQRDLVEETGVMTGQESAIQAG